MPTAAQQRLPRLAIVGRPNVGKSTLANRMCGTRVAIVEPTAGVTRDRISVPARLRTDDGEHWFEVIDTGGVGVVDRDDLGPHVQAQVQTALKSAELVLFVVDVRDGVTPLDLEAARLLRGSPRPVVLVANKAEGAGRAVEASEFLRLGMPGEPFAISAQNGEGLSPLYERIVELLPHAPTEMPELKPVLKLAVVGRRNAGKSTLINAWAGEERMIVSEIPGTTRDAVDVLFERGGERFVAIDTAGVRKRNKLEDAIEFYGESRSRRAMRRADVVLLLFDVTQPLSGIEKRMARYALDRYKPVVLGANKWDLAKDFEPEDFRAYLDEQLSGLSFAPVVFLSGLKRERVFDTLSLARELFEQSRLRVSTGELNRVLEEALTSRSPSRRGHGVRMYYATQADIAPPTFVLFVNDKRLIGKHYLRYLQNRIREHLPLTEIPVRIVLRDKREDGEARDLSKEQARR
jgi:GTP-binding protein